MKYGKLQGSGGCFRKSIIHCFTLFLLYAFVHPTWGIESQKQVVTPGDGVQIHFVCKETSGDMIMTSIQSIAEDTAKKRSGIYQTPEKFEPLLIIAGQGATYSGPDPLKIFKNELAARLSDQIVGMQVGESASVTLTASVPEGLTDSERYISLSKTRIVQKVVTQPKEKVVALLEREPVMGEEFITALGLLGKVIKISDKEVTVSFGGKTENQCDTPWGKGVLEDQGENWQLLIHPEIGKLVLTGPYVGRVSSVGDKMYTIDFGFPFGSESIVCDISVIAILNQQHSKKR